MISTTLFTLAAAIFAVLLVACFRYRIWDRTPSRETLNFYPQRTIAGEFQYRLNDINPNTAVHPLPVRKRLRSWALAKMHSIEFGGKRASSRNRKGGEHAHRRTAEIRPVDLRCSPRGPAGAEEADDLMDATGRGTAQLFDTADTVE